MIEELIVAVLRRRESTVVEMLEEALHSGQPLDVFKTVSDPKAAAAGTDLILGRQLFWKIDLSPVVTP
jgi:hypothetical protein